MHICTSITSTSDPSFITCAHISFAVSINTNNSACNCKWQNISCVMIKASTGRNNNNYHELWAIIIMLDIEFICVVQNGCWHTNHALVLYTFITGTSYPSFITGAHISIAFSIHTWNSATNCMWYKISVKIKPVTELWNCTTILQMVPIIAAIIYQQYSACTLYLDHKRILSSQHYKHNWLRLNNNHFCNMSYTILKIYFYEILNIPSVW